MCAENMVKVCFTVLLVILLTVIGTNTSVAAGRKRPHVTKSDDVMVIEYDFEEPDITTEGDIDFVTISGFKRYNKAGAPALPVYPVSLLLPEGRKILQIWAEVSDATELKSEYKLASGQKPPRKPVPETQTRLLAS